MPRIDIFLSNDGHHATMFRPVVRQMMEGQNPPRVRFLSLCEFRGLRTPLDLLDTGADVERVLPFRFRRGSGGLHGGGNVHGTRRRVLRRLSWEVLLKRRIEALLENRPALVVVPNDAAFPYDLVTEELKRRTIPFVLVQEGIRFPMPSVDGDRYGKSGALAIAAWGENSRAFFRSQGVPDDRIFITGNPRFDRVLDTDWNAESRRLKKEIGLGARTLLFVTNPIDAQGFCSPREKVSLVFEYLRRIESLFNDPEFSVVVKIHGGESRSNYEALFQALAFVDRVHLLQHANLYALFRLADAAIVLASTVGLEALMFDCPLGVLEIPGYGYVHDYVQSGAAIGLGWHGDILRATKQLLEGDAAQRRSGALYVRENLAFVGSSSERIAEVLTDKLGVAVGCA